MERIISIKEVDGYARDNSYSSFDGFEVVTTKHTYFFGISNGQSCCEDWGYFITNDSIEDFFNATLFSVDIVNECLIKEKAPSIYEGGVMFINFETSHGTLQFTAYNGHNGYYAHEAIYTVDGNVKESDYL